MTLCVQSVIHTLRGDLFLLDLIDQESPIYVFTWDGERVTVGIAEVTKGPPATVMRLELDDGSSIFISADATVLLKEGGTAKVRDLKPKTSLQPLYLGYCGNNYPVYKEPGDWHKGGNTLKDSWRRRPVSRMVAEWKTRRRCMPGDRITHIDGSRLNCEPDNIQIKSRSPKRRKQKSDFEPLFEAQRFLDDNDRDANNHKVKSVALARRQEMFSIKGLATDNLAVGGIFITTDMG